MPFSFHWWNKREPQVGAESNDQLPSDVRPTPRLLGIWDGPRDEQHDCVLFTKLPVELRIEIYKFVFLPTLQKFHLVERLSKQKGTGEVLGISALKSDGNVSNESDPGIEEGEKSKSSHLDMERSTRRRKPAHPLSFLLTCRRINDEATVIAYRSHDFTITEPLPYYYTREHLMILSVTQTLAISCLSLLMDEGNPSLNSTLNFANQKISGFMENAVLLFPNVKTLIIRNRLYNWNLYYKSCRALERADYGQALPSWLISAISLFVGATRFRWQKGEKWTAQYRPGHRKALLSASSSSSSSSFSVPNGQLEAPFSQPSPQYTTQQNHNEEDDCAVLLTQETGRQIRVYCHFEIADAACDSDPTIRLFPGTHPPLPVKQVSNKMGYEGYMWHGEQACCRARTCWRKQNH